VGTVNEQENAPEEVVVIVGPLDEPSEHVVGDTSTPSKATVAPELTVNPEPVTVKELPTGPWSGVTVMATVVTVNEPLAVSPPLFVAVTADPEVPEGTSKVQVNDPSLSEVRDPSVQLVIVTWSKTSEASGIEGVNPVPATVTSDPTGPCSGVIVIASGVTVNVTVFDWPPVATSAAFTL
jgi:hypothetical protein